LCLRAGFNPLTPDIVENGGKVVRVFTFLCLHGGMRWHCG